MTPYIPDVASPAPAASQRLAAKPDAGTFGAALDAAGTALGNADRAEENFAAGTGNLQDAIYERARADVVLAIATAAAQRAGQALQAIMTMQV